MEAPTPCVCGAIVELDEMWSIRGTLPDGGNLVCRHCLCQRCQGDGCRRCNSLGYRVPQARRSAQDDQSADRENG